MNPTRHKYSINSMANLKGDIKKKKYQVFSKPPEANKRERN